MMYALSLLATVYTSLALGSLGWLDSRIATGLKLRLGDNIGTGFDEPGLTPAGIG
jgi:hypothetical protein